MTTIRQLIQTSPIRAIDLFAKLVDTSDTAVKTRDRLLSELKVELDLQAKLEEQHLFPVLRKHEETKGLVADALNDNREARKLLAELEGTPKDSEDFGHKVAELKKTFQQHIRDDRKDFLPAIEKALSDEEAGTVVEKIEDEKERIEAAQRAESDERRDEAKRQRERAEAKAAKDKAKAEAQRATQKEIDAASAKANAITRKSAGESKQGKAVRRVSTRRKVPVAQGLAADVVRSNAEMAQQGARAARKVTKAGANGANRMTEAVRAATGSKATEEAVSETDAVSTGLSMLAVMSEQARHSIRTMIEIGRARTLAEVFIAQSDFLAASFRRMRHFNERYRALLGGGMGSASFHVPNAERLGGSPPSHKRT